jgi:oligoendopeptidase F
MLQELTPQEQRQALFEKLDDAMATIFRQTAFFNFELDLHAAVRKEGNLSHEELALLLNKHLKAYMGGHCTFTPDDGYSFVFIGHFRYFFYVYSYVYGELISHALYERYREDPSYIKQIERFLSAGGSTPPYEIFKDIGIDTKDPNFWKSGLQAIDDDVKRLESLL